MLRQIARRIPFFRTIYFSRFSKQLLAETSAIAGRLGRSAREDDLQPADHGLSALGAQYLPTKRVHNYLIRYDHVFGPIRHNVKKMVEIGVQTDLSVRMWRDYFPNAEIVGIDIDPDCRRFNSDRIRIEIGDQTDPGFLSRFARDHLGSIDIIVDDGLHSREAITTSFKHLYPALSPHGIYAIEDLVNHQYVRALAGDIAAAINYWPQGTTTRLWQVLDDLGPGAGWFAKNTVGMEFYRHILFVKRGHNPSDNPFFLPKEQFAESMNRGLKEVDGAATRIRAQGKKVTVESLVDIVGFQKRYYAEEYMAGVRSYAYDQGTRSWQTIRQ